MQALLKINPQVSVKKYHGNKATCLVIYPAWTTVCNAKVMPEFLNISFICM